MKDKFEQLFKKVSSSIQDFLNNLSFQVRLIITIIFSISVFITLCAFLIIQNIQSNIDRQVLTLNHNLKTTQILAQISAQALLMGYKNVSVRKGRLSELVNNFIKEHPEVAYVVITDNAGNVLCRSHYAHFYKIYKKDTRKTKIIPPQHVPFIKMSYSKNGKLLVIAEPIQFNSNFLGWVWIGIPDTGFTIVGSKKELITFLFEIFLLVWALSVIGAIVNSMIITRPLRKLEKGAKAIAEGRFGFQLPFKGFLGKELSQLVKAFNKMSKMLKQYEESNLAILSSERNKFESVVMSIADGVIVLDKEDIIQIVNPAARRLLNRSGDELLGQKIIGIWDSKVNEKLSNYLNNIKCDVDSHISEYVTFEAVTESKHLKLTLAPMYNTQNENLGTVIAIHDRTKEVEIELIKQEFISNVSHELRTPITSIKCYVDTLCFHPKDINEKTQNEFLMIINEETDRLIHLVNDVLELSRLESPRAKLNLSIQDIYPPIEYALKSILVLAEKKSIRIIKEIEENLPQLNINQENIERVLVNLLSNAIKYTPGNGTVKLTVKKEDLNNIVFRVIDNGIGIPQEHLPMIFDRFYRVENKVHTIKGTGLGLTIVKKSIEQHNGTISARSKLGEGSIFEFTLPLPMPMPMPEETAKIKDLEAEPRLAKSA
ncbi:MAG: hypothetical protein A3B68_04170 [Candidatus Melainabacteria bacterium RIFCSPHIGHO2_02_FULL_34_12]|nr:MAG: hypothetical protein A3B68_04170 [Candidatus Melainabacteria bacterium RIFCSPHIGHO2_02_FULL_34_12]